MLNSEDHLNVVSENVTANLPKSLRDQLMELGLKGSATSPESQKTPVSSTTAKPQDNDINTIRALSAIGKGMVTVNRAALPKRFSISTIRAYIRTHDTNGELSALEIFYAFVGFGKVYGYDEAAINYQRLILPLSNFAGEIAAQLALDNTDETEISHFRQSVSLLASQEAISMEPFRAAESSVLRPHWERLGAQQKQVLEMARQLACTDFSTSFFTPVLNALDISLAISWSDRSELKVLLDDKPPYRIDTNSLIKTCGRH